MYRCEARRAEAISVFASRRLLCSARNDSLHHLQFDHYLVFEVVRMDAGQLINPRWMAKRVNSERLERFSLRIKLVR